MPTQSKRERGFTVLELLIVVACVGITVFYFGLVKTVIKGNYWVSDAGALQCVQVVDPSVTRLVRVQRNAWALSEVTVEDVSSERSTFTLDSDVLLNAVCARK